MPGVEEDEELVAAVSEDNDIDRIDPLPAFLTLASGIEVHVLPLRTRELFKLLRIITHGAGQQLMNAGLDFTDETGVFLQKLLGIILFSIPDAENETVAFLQAMVEPAGLPDKPVRDLSKQEREGNIEAWTRLNLEMYNPDPQDTISILEHVVRRESADLQSLGKRLRGFLELASKTGQLKAEPASNGNGSRPEDLSLPDLSPASSTSSAASTAGPTRKSSASPSAGSGTSSRPSRSASGRKSAPSGS